MSIKKLIRKGSEALQSKDKDMKKQAAKKKLKKHKKAASLGVRG